MKAENKTYLIAKHPADNEDIIYGIESVFKKSCDQVRQGKFAEKFRGDSVLESASNVWDYLKYKCLYQVDGFNQDIALPARLVSDNLKTPRIGHDCKSFALFGASVMSVLYPKAKVCFRYVSFKSDPTPTHVYCVVKDDGGTIIIDGVYNKFNAEKPYKHKKDHCMQVRAIAGLGNYPKVVTNENDLVALRNHYAYGSPQREAINNRIRGIGNAYDDNIKDAQLVVQRQYTEHHAITSDQYIRSIAWIMTNQKNNVNGQKLNHYDGFHIARLALQLVGASQEALDYLDGKSSEATAHTTFGSKVFGKFMTVVGSGPRTAFLELVSINGLGLASRLALAIAKNEAAVKDFWNKGGGNFTTLKKKVNHGKSKRPIFAGAKGKAAAALTGIGELATIASLLVASAAVIAEATHLLNQLGIGEKDGVVNPLVVDPDAPVPTDTLDTINNVVDSLIPIDLPIEAKYGIVAVGGYFLARQFNLIPKLF